MDVPLSCHVIPQAGFDTGHFARGGGGNISSIAYSGFVEDFFCWWGDRLHVYDECV